MIEAWGQRRMGVDFSSGLIEYLKVLVPGQMGMLLPGNFEAGFNRIADALPFPVVAEEFVPPSFRVDNNAIEIKDKSFSRHKEIIQLDKTTTNLVEVYRRINYDYFTKIRI